MKKFILKNGPLINKSWKLGRVTLSLVGSPELSAIKKSADF